MYCIIIVYIIYDMTNPSSINISRQQGTSNNKQQQATTKLSRWHFRSRSRTARRNPVGFVSTESHGRGIPECASPIP